mmetsp:Transcript_126847/g.317005  ORF Transcript_126847/g.317005 Transcript_126847/m.317005 type:complete len:204 (+) Transcript_126847:486-1097(+)
MFCHRLENNLDACLFYDLLCCCDAVASKVTERRTTSFCHIHNFRMHAQGLQDQSYAPSLHDLTSCICTATSYVAKCTASFDLDIYSCRMCRHSLQNGLYASELQNPCPCLWAFAEQVAQSRASKLLNIGHCRVCFHRPKHTSTAWAIHGCRWLLAIAAPTAPIQGGEEFIKAVITSYAHLVFGIPEKRLGLELLRRSASTILL